MLGIARMLTTATGKAWHEKAFLSSLPADALGGSITAYGGAPAPSHFYTPAYSDKERRGWPVGMDREHLDTTPRGRCDILALDAPDGAVASMREFLRSVLCDQPVMLRGAASGSRLRRDFSIPGPWLDKYGSSTIESAILPPGTVQFAASGLQKDSITLAEYVERIKAISEAPDTGAPQGYTFSSQFVRDHPDLKQYYEAPELLQGLGAIPHFHQFAMGPSGSGAAWHINDMAINVLGYGRKRWFLQRPGIGNFTIKPVRAWLANDYATVQDSVLECVQEPGDVLFLPSFWNHQTLNIEASVGFGHFFRDIGSEANISISGLQAVVMADVESPSAIHRKSPSDMDEL